MVNFTQMRDLSIKMELLVFENVIGKFQKHIFSIRLIQGKEIDVFIKNNIEKLFKTNGLVHPHY